LQTADRLLTLVDPIDCRLRPQSRLDSQCCGLIPNSIPLLQLPGQEYMRLTSCILVSDMVALLSLYLRLHTRDLYADTGFAHCSDVIAYEHLNCCKESYMAQLVETLKPLSATLKSLKMSGGWSATSRSNECVRPCLTAFSTLHTLVGLRAAFTKIDTFVEIGYDNESNVVEQNNNYSPTTVPPFRSTSTLHRHVLVPLPCETSPSSTWMAISPHDWNTISTT
jgi:hypothetical protein